MTPLELQKRTWIPTGRLKGDFPVLFYWPVESKPWILYCVQDKEQFYVVARHKDTQEVMQTWLILEDEIPMREH